MFFQRILAKLDNSISDLFQLSSSKLSMTSVEGHVSSVSSFFSDFGPRIAIVRADGKCKLLTGYFTVLHYHEDGILTKRISARKDIDVNAGERIFVGNAKAYQAYNLANK